MKHRILKTTVSAIALWAMSVASLAAEQVEGLISGVGDAAVVDIRLPEGAAVASGDPVTILVDIPGVGLIAIDTTWEVISTSLGTATARPQSEPDGLPQVGYVARIETQAVASASEDAEPNVRSAATAPAPAKEEMLTDVPVSQEAEAYYLRGSEFLASSDPAALEQGVDHLRRAATMRHPEAMSDLATAYAFGRGIDRDDQMARDWLDLAIKLGSASAMLRLGLMHMTGHGVPVDEMEASHWLHKSAAYGDAQGMYVVAMLYEEGYGGVAPDMWQLVSRLEQSAKAGHVPAMFLVGDIYEGGEDGIIPADERKAEYYLVNAAEAGHVDAMEKLANLYRGTYPEHAAKWEAAARNAAGLPDWTEDPRCLSAWECYGRDERSPELYVALPPDKAAAPETSAVLEPSSELRTTSARQSCDRAAASPRDPDLPDPSWAVPYGRVDPAHTIEACLSDIARWPDTRRFHTQLATGYHKAGRYQEALQALSAAAEMGSTQAMAMIALMQKNGTGMPQNKPAALEAFEAAGFQGNVTAMHFAAHMHLRADGVSYNPKAAAEWFQAAADQGNGEAMAQLGILYDSRQGVPYDPYQAATNLMLGLKMGSPLAERTLSRDFDRLSPHTLTAVQQLLRNDGLYSGPLDGKFGPMTLKALKAVPRY